VVVVVCVTLVMLLPKLVLLPSTQTIAQ